MKPQTRRTLAVLRSRGADGLTPLEALELVGTQRLAARVYELEAAGYRITRTLVDIPRGGRVARYVLHEAPVQLDLGVA
jgi:hypothetical protein